MIESRKKRLAIAIALVLGAFSLFSSGQVAAAVGDFYQYIAKWGRFGSSSSQFYGPSGVALDSTGNVYVADTYNHRIQGFTATKKLISSWGSSGAVDGQFSYPGGIALDASGNIYVADTNNHRIQKFTSTGGFLAKWGSAGAGDGQFNCPNGIALDASGTVYIADTNNHRIQKFTSTGGFLAKWGSRGAGDGQFYFPKGMAVDTSGNMYVADTNNHRIQKFTSTGGFLAKWGSRGAVDGQFSYPSGIALDASGNIYVADTNNHRIQKFTSTGGFIVKWGSYGAENGQFRNPRGLGVDASGNVYVANTSSHNIKKYGYDVFGPTPSFTINAKAAATNSRAVVLAISATDNWGSGVSQMRFSNDGSNWSSWQGYLRQADWMLTPGDGTKTVRAQFLDYAGNISSIGTDSIIFDTKAPSLRLFVPGYSTDNCTTGTVKLGWSAKDRKPSSGIKADDCFAILRRQGGGARRFGSSWQQNDSRMQFFYKGKPGKTYALEVTVKDRAGNTAKKRKNVTFPYDQDSHLKERVGFDHEYVDGANFHKGTVRYSDSAGDHLVYQFKRKRVALIATKAPDRSKADIHLDGKYLKTIDLYSSKTRYRQVIFSATLNSKGPHSLKIVNRGTTGRPIVDIDAIAIRR